MTTKIKVVIADDYSIIRLGLIKILSADTSIEVIGESSDGLETLQLIKKLKPDIAILDISMPGMDGLEILRQAQAEKLKFKSIILTMYKEEEYFNVAMDLGVNGYLLKDNAVIDILTCVKSVAENKFYISPLISDYWKRRQNNH